mgnify:FL=1
MTGVDISEKFLDRKLERDGLVLVSADASALPIPDGSVDAVVSYEFIEHVVRVAEVLDEMIRVVRPGGTILILSPNLVSPFLPLKNILDIIRGRVPAEVGGRTLGQAGRLVFRNLWLSLEKVFSGRVSFLLRTPDLSRPAEADADSVYPANQIDLRRYLRQRGLVLVGGSEGHTFSGRLLAYAFPWMCGECCVMARKPAN